MTGPSLEAPPHVTASTGYVAGWWQRFWAEFVDGIVILAASAVLFAIGGALDKGAAWVVVGVGIFTMVVFYRPLMLSLNGGQTLGKKALGVRVVNVDSRPIGFGRAFVRETVLKLVPSFLSPFNLIDYLWAAFRDDRRSLHDLGARTLVVDS
jgi:uncharacterized RDD family membrane protein YckC